MFYARNEKNVPIPAMPGGIGDCPMCRERLIPKCGEIVSWHWSHRVNDCDPWYEPETEWHLGWKRQVPPSNCEVVMGPHRADMVGRNGIVIELQRASLETWAARERQEFYRARGLFLWVFYAAEFRENLSLRNREGEEIDFADDPDRYRSFRWKWPRMSQRMLVPLFWDFDDGWMFEVRKIYAGTPCGGWGYWLRREEFLQKYVGDELRFRSPSYEPGWAYLERFVRDCEVAP